MIHGACCASAKMARIHGRIGRSGGSFVFSQAGLARVWPGWGPAG